jgi:hypothetical protein
MAGIAIAAYAGLALSAGGMAASFAQAAKQRRAQEDAEANAAQAMAAARKKLEVNYLDALAVQKEPYELEREALLAAGAQGVDASRESERGAAAGVGRIQLAQQKGQQGIRTAMGQEMTALDKAAAAEESRLRDVGVQLDLGEVAGAQMASADAGQAAAAAQTQGFQQLASFGAQAAGAANLYSKSGGARQAGVINRQGGGQDVVNQKISNLSNTQGVPTEGQAAFQAKPQVGVNIGDTVKGFGVEGLPGYTPDSIATVQSENFAPAQNIFDGVDITPIMNNPTTEQMNAFLADQDPEWAKRFRIQGLGIQRKSIF